MNIRLIAFNCRYSHSCLALFYVRNELEKYIPSCSLSIEQFTINDPYYETLLKITGFQAESLFFSVYIWNASYLCRLLNDLHSIAPELPIVLGGPQAPALREKLTFKPTVVHRQIEGIERSFYHDVVGGTLQRDYWAEAVHSFGYPYKKEDFQDQLLNRNIYYESSRGCPFFCAYCLSSTSRGVVFKDLDLVKKELLDIISYSPKILRFVDRTFNADPDRTLELWRFIKDHADETSSFHFEIAPDLFSEEMFQFLEGVRGNFFQFEIGVQSTNPKTLAAVNRKIDLEKSFVNIKRLKDLGTINLHLDLILGLPEENQKSFAQSIRDGLALQPHYLQVGLLKVLPDTALALNIKALGIKACHEPPYQVLATQAMDHKTISHLYWLGECVEAFYNKGYFKTFFSYAIMHENDIFLFFEQLLTLCSRGNFFSLARTQVLMNDLLFALVDSHKDRAVLIECLILDWLLCGHRYLPAVFELDINTHKKFLWKNAPQELEGLYTKPERNFFFKKGVFFKFSSVVLSPTGISDADADSFVIFETNEVNGKIKETMVRLIPFESIFAQLP